jgi:hypothetical protein
MIVIPKYPEVLRLAVGRLWNGQSSGNARLGAFIELQQNEHGVLVRVTTPPLISPKIPEAPIGTRVDKLWEFDAVELFFVDEDGQYLEVELGLGGHYLVLGFDAPRHLVADFVDVPFETHHEVIPDGRWVNGILIPRDLFPTNLKALNAYMIAGGQFLAYHPLPGAEPDFHKPELFPFARLA